MFITRAHQRPFLRTGRTYAAGAWMRRSCDVQEVLYAARGQEVRSGDVQDVLMQRAQDDIHGCISIA
ncbi:MAG: hypothetical protein MI865_06760 [Proteobacteria bacterium]|nr:hypothetical protein [Pseudomonadota bacterium]